MTETDLSRAIQDALKASGFWVLRIQSGRVPLGGGRYMYCAEPGTPDLHLPAFGAWLEVKVPNGRLNPAQTTWHSKAAQYGVRVATVRSVAEAIKIATAWKKEREHRRAMGWDE